jgi:hypothetical protein
MMLRLALTFPSCPSLSIAMTEPSKSPSSSYKSVDRERDTTSGGNNLTQSRNIGWWARLIPFCILIPVIVSLVVVILHTREYTTTGKLL